MKKDKKPTPLVDEHLQSLAGMREAETDAFFYTRLKAAMDAAREKEGWSLPLRPAWIVACLVVLLAVNSLITVREFTGKQDSMTNSADLETFATSYNQTINTAY